MAFGLPLGCTGLAFAALSVVLSSCTPVAAVSRDGMSGKQGVSAQSDSGAAGSNSAVEPDAASRTVTAKVADSCQEPGERRCSTSDLRTPLVCKKSQWQPQTVCSESERCETAEGAQRGLCVAIASECLNHQSGEEFCDGDLVRSCDKLVPSKSRPCEDRRRCMEVGGKPQCVCAPGWLDDGSGGGCQVATSCMTRNGGCDPLAQCSQNGGARVCGACPAGFEGNGETGCYAQLSALTLDAGVLAPAFAPEIHSYRISLPLLRQSVQVTAQAVEGVQITIDSVDQKPGASWRSPALQLGEHKVEISLTTRFGLASKYELLITRSGAQDAYLKAADPDNDDEFGGSVALWGDTLAIGAPAEDSSGRSTEVDNAAEGSGAVYVFVRNGATWTQQAYLKANPPRAGDHFGMSVGLREDTLVIGAPGANLLALNAPHEGSVHVFARQAGQWSFQSKVAPPDTGAQDLFGQSVALDDKRLIVGAPFESSAETFSGAFYTYARSGNNFSQTQRVKAVRPLPSGLFGWSLAVEADTLVVGGPQYNPLSPSSTGPGTAYVFGADTMGWTQLQELTPAASLEDGATFGWTVDILGNTLAVGAPRARTSNVGQGPGDAFLYERATGGSWGMAQAFRAIVPRASDWYGFVVKLTPTTLLIGSPGDASGSNGLMGDPKNDALHDSGAMYVYGRNQSEWVNTAFVKASNPDNPDYFGSAIAVYGDTVVSTSPSESGDAPGVDGNQANNTLTYAGAAYVFH